MNPAVSAYIWFEKCPPLQLLGVAGLTAAGREVPLGLECEEGQGQGDPGRDTHRDQDSVHLEITPAHHILALNCHQCWFGILQVAVPT